MGVEGIIIGLAILGIVILAGGSIFQSYLDGVLGFVNVQANQAQNTIPTPPKNSPVCDLVIKFEPKVTSSSVPFAHGYILHLNENGGKLTYQWQNCHLKEFNWLNAAQLLDFLDLKIRGTDLPLNELGGPILSPIDKTFTVSFKIVDQDLRTKLVPIHQDLPFKVKAASGQGQVFSQVIRFFDLAREDYTLEITIKSSDFRFANHDFQEPYRQQINAP